MLGNNKNGIRLLESSKGDILLTTMTNICLYNSSEERFEPVIYDFDTSSIFVINSFMDAQDNCWVVTSKDLRCYSLLDYRKTFSISCNEFCKASYLLDNEELWMAGNCSVSIFDIRQRKYMALPEAIASHPILSHVPVEFIYPYENGVLLCTQGKGIFYYNRISKTVIREKMDSLLKCRILGLAVCLVIRRGTYGLVR